MGPEMADGQNDKPPVVRSPESGSEVARQAEGRLRVAQIAREIEELGRALDARDRLAKIGTAKRAESRPAQAGQPARGIADRSTPALESLPTVSDMSRAPKMVSSQVGRFATIPAIPQQHKLIAGGGRPTRGRRRWPSLAAVITVLFLGSGGTLMLMDPSNEIAHDAYRRAMAEMQRLNVRENAETETVARKANSEKPMLEEAERKAADEELAAAASRHEEEARQATEGKVRAEAAREMAEAQARTAAQEAAKRKAEDTRLKKEEPLRKAAEGARRDAEVREQAEKAEAGLKLTEQDRKRAQVALNALGHTIPTATGYFGPRTRAMITAWQETQGLPATGYLTEAQLAVLRQQAAAALAK
jgi:hypothetical protein